MQKTILPLLASSKLLIEKEFFNKIVLEEILNNGEPLNSEHSIPLLSDGEIIITDNLNSTDIGNEAVYYHPIFGPIIAHDYGYPGLFSTQRFVSELKEADESPNIVAHFLHISSGGGESWFLDKAAEAVSLCKKPVYAFIEYYGCSAAYYLACKANIIKTYTPNDTIGSLGTMVSGWNMDGYLESLGCKKVEAYASRSDLKNKISRDLDSGKPSQYITERLDPIQDQFEQAVRDGRKKLNSLPDDHAVFRGHIFYASEAEEIGLIDGIIDIEDAIVEAYNMGVLIKNNNNLLNNF